MQGSYGYSPNRNVRTSSNGRRARHGYNYRLAIQYCAELNRNRKNRVNAVMFSSVAEAFKESKKRLRRKR